MKIVTTLLMIAIALLWLCFVLPDGNTITPSVSTPNIKQQDLKTGVNDVINFEQKLRDMGIDQSLISHVDYETHYAVIEATNVWHIQPYQTRYQMAQNLWKQWAYIHSPSDADKARVKIVDYNGNVVGGSRLIAGSLIWVKK